MDYFDQEEAKKEAWAVLRDKDATTDKKTWYALHKLIAAHYWREKNALEKSNAKFRRRVHGVRYSPHYELDIDVYTRHWMWANADRCLPPEVIAMITDFWGYRQEEHKMMPKGLSMYGEKPAPAMITPAIVHAADECL